MAFCSRFEKRENIMCCVHGSSAFLTTFSDSSKSGNFIVRPTNLVKLE